MIECCVSSHIDPNLFLFEATRKLREAGIPAAVKGGNLYAESGRLIVSEPMNLVGDLSFYWFSDEEIAARAKEKI